MQSLRNGNSDLWIYDIQRGVPTRLTFDEAHDSAPIWSPDGQFLAFLSSRDGTPNIYRTRADGSGTVERLTESAAEQYLDSWSADGRFLSYSQDQGPPTGWDILVMPLEEDREPEVFVSTDALEDDAAFSPNGRWIAYLSDESGSPEVYVRPYPPGPGKWQLSSNGGGQPRWSPDGRELFYRTNTGIMVVAVDTDGDSFTYSRAEQLFEGSFLGGLAGLLGGFGSDYDVTGDGQRFVMFPDTGQSSQSGSGHVTLVTNWFDELKRLVPTDP